MLHEKLPADFQSKATVVICFCECQGKFLVLQRAKGKAEENTWTAPGGKLEKNESPRQGIVREFWEEARLSLDVQKLIEEGHYYVNIQKNWNFVLYIFRYRLDVFPSEVVLSEEEHQKFQWVSFQEALALPLISGAKDCILKVMSRAC